VAEGVVVVKRKGELHLSAYYSAVVRVGVSYGLSTRDYVHSVPPSRWLESQFTFSMTSPLPSPTSAGLTSPIMRSLDSERDVTPSSFNRLNGHIHNGVSNSSDEEELDPVARLEKELQHTREEKETLASQYNNLLAKLTAMRTTLGNKLKQDAVCCILSLSACQQLKLLPV